jgi:hypothetical protein
MPLSGSDARLLVREQAWSDLEELGAFIAKDNPGPPLKSYASFASPSNNSPVCRNWAPW